jgi:hypothetical protein
MHRGMISTLPSDPPKHSSTCTSVSLEHLQNCQWRKKFYHCLSPLKLKTKMFSSFWTTGTITSFTQGHSTVEIFQHTSKRTLTVATVTVTASISYDLTRVALCCGLEGFRLYFYVFFYERTETCHTNVNDYYIQKSYNISHWLTQFYELSLYYRSWGYLCWLEV